jgi:hypothetical protein
VVSEIEDMWFSDWPGRPSTSTIARRVRDLEERGAFTLKK